MYCFIYGPTCCVIQLLEVTWHVNAFCEACCVVLKLLILGHIINKYTLASRPDLAFQWV